MNSNTQYPRCAEADDFFQRLFQDCAAVNPALAVMAERFHHSGVNILTLVDHWLLPSSERPAAILESWGFREEIVDGDAVWTHPLARFPRIRFGDVTRPRPALAVEDVALFLQANSLTANRKAGEPDSHYEEAICFLAEGEIAIVARRGYAGFRPESWSGEQEAILAGVRAAFRDRGRNGEEAVVIAEAARLARETIDAVGLGRATDEFFAAEREFYLTRNAAARWQYAQQQKLGLGWANHDHHTYRSSRVGFRALMGLWQTFGFVMRERFYAGAEAGWGAQILEHPQSRVVLFCDVDVAPDELEIDFAGTELLPRPTLGTIGLWCALHGSSIASAGMHHLECEFVFADAQAGLERAGFGVMAPFTDLPMLKQAFTLPETWPVPLERVQTLSRQGLITPGQADQFLKRGAAGSHLEILQRWDGFKGFNKTGVSAIIKETDARLVARV